MNQDELCGLLLKAIPYFNTFQPPALTQPVSIFGFSAIQLNDKYLQRWCLHRHTFHELHFIFSGEVDYQFENGMHATVQENQWILLPKEKSHSISQARNHAIKISFLFQLSPKDSVPLSQCFTQLVSDSTFLIGNIEKYHQLHIEQICKAIQQKNPLTPMLCWNSAISLILNLMEEMYLQNKLQAVITELPPSMDQRYLSAAQFIHDNCLRHINVSEVAEHCHLSSKQLNRIFLKETGNTITHYIQHQRLLASQKKLLSDDRPLYLISSELGFCDEFYFSRFFTKMTHMSPSQFRMENQRKNNIMQDISADHPDSSL